MTSQKANRPVPLLIVGAILIILAVSLLVVFSPFGAAEEPAGCAGQEEKAIEPELTMIATGYSDISPTEAMAIINEGKVVVVDLSPIWANGHLPGAISMPFSSINEERTYLSTALAYLIYYHSDAASMQGAETFVKNGFCPVYRLEGNYQGWVDVG